VEHWQKNWEQLLERVEKGETIGVVNEKGERAVMMIADDDIMKLYREQNNEAS